MHHQPAKIPQNVPLTTSVSAICRLYCVSTGSVSIALVYIPGALAATTQRVKDALRQRPRRLRQEQTIEGQSPLRAEQLWKASSKLQMSSLGHASGNEMLSLLSLRS